MNDMRTDIFDRVRPILQHYDVRGFVVPANTGYSARAAHAAFGAGYQYIVVGNPVESATKDYVYNSGMTDEVQKELSGLGMDIVLHEHSCFAQKNPSPAFWRHNKAFQDSFVQATKDKGVESVEIKGATLASILDNAFAQLCDQGFKTAVEMALLAGSCPRADLARYYVSFAFPSRWGDIRDVAIVSRIGTPETFFTRRLDLQAVILSNEPRG